jgi:2,3-dihydroxybiphenyl 1,2-dioxygenase
VSAENAKTGTAPAGAKRAGVSQLGYIAFEVSDLAAWEAFGTRILGLEVGSRRADGAFTLRMDGRAARFFITPGPANDLACLGWETAGEAELREVVARLREAGVTVREASEDERVARGVKQLFAFNDPAGNPSEVYFGPALAETPFHSDVVRAGFVGEEQGLGHAVIRANTKAESTRFYCEVLGLRLSDSIICEFYGYPVDLSFFHANARHHSVAFGEHQRKRIHHFMLEVRSMDDVGLAFDRTLKGGIRIMQTLGKHPNDGMFSFYARTPAGFQFEMGWGGTQVDDATWAPTTYDRISDWGHHPPEAFAPPKRPEVAPAAASAPSAARASRGETADGSSGARSSRE